MIEWILLLSQQLLEVSTICSHTCANTPTPLVNYCIVNDALPFHAKRSANAAITFYDFKLLERLSFDRRNYKAGKKIKSLLVSLSSDAITVETQLVHVTFLFAFSSRFVTNLNF